MERLLIQSCMVLDPSRSEIYEADILIEDGVIKKIAGGGEIDAEGFEEEEVIDAWGRYLAPGLVDAHLHIESSMLTPLEFAKTALVHGTTSIFVDPHEIANVRKEGIELFIKLSELAPLDMYVGVPSCVPATHLEDAGAEVTIEDIKRLISHPRVYGLAEMMNFPGIIYGFGNAREKVDLVFEYGKIVDGHCPGVSGEQLKTYISNGKNDGVVRIMSDHESTSYEEAREKASLGMFVALRFGSASKDLERILPSLIKNQDPLENFMLCSDDLEAEELLVKGHIDRTVRRVRQIIMENSILSLEDATLIALKLASHNPGRYFEKFFKLVGEPGIGEIKEGKRANLVIFNDLENLIVNEVIVQGKLVAEAGTCLAPTTDFNYRNFLSTVNLGKSFSTEDFRINCPEPSAKVNVIEVIPNSLLTKKLVLEMKPENGELKPDPEKDIAKIVVIERHKATGKYALGFVKGLGIKKGAVASTVAHDSHNLIVVGMDDGMMAEAVNRIANTGGGMMAIGPELEAFHPLEICGLLSARSLIEISGTYKAVRETAKALGSPLDNIFMTLSFLALPVIPELKITNQGLVEVGEFKVIKLCEG